jgi:hypothetical protein
MATAKERAARERKQKIFVLVGGLALLLLVAIQLPRLLGGSSSSSAAPAAETQPSVDGTAPVPAATAPVVLVDSSRRPGSLTGKLTSFGAFTRKDPFVQQAVTPAPAGTGTLGGGGESSKETPSKDFKPTVTPKAALTVVSVNGARQVLVAGRAFPAADPVFVLVAEQAGAKTVTVGVAGGAYTDGAQATKLKLGKPLVLVNTTTGARYRLVLISVGTGDVQEKAKS